MSDPIIQFELIGPMTPKGRPRFKIIKPRGRPQFVSTYTDSATVKYEELISAAARVAMSGCAPLDEPLAVLFECYLPIPASWPKRDQEAAREFDKMPVGTPDWDNLGKVASDACNKIVWTDDSIIVRATVQKAYSENPLLRISVWGWER